MENPFSSGYKLIYPDWTKPVPDDVIPHIIEIGKVGIDVQAPGDATAFVLERWDKNEAPSIDYIRKNYVEIPAYAVRDGMLFIDFSTESGYRWFIGDDRLEEKWEYKSAPEYFGRVFAKFLDFVNNNMGVWVK